VAVAAAAARAAESEGGGGAHITPPTNNQALAAAATVVLVAHRAQRAGVAALTRAVEGACAHTNIFQRWVLNILKGTVV
jgi:hypothetical protein